MEVVYLPIPVAILLVIVIIWLFFRAIKSGQFDDLEGQAHQIIMDKEKLVEESRSDSDKTD